MVRVALLISSPMRGFSGNRRVRGGMGIGGIGPGSDRVADIVTR